MDNIKNNINFLKNVIENRETYIRFSPLGTAIMGFMYIAYYLLKENLYTVKYIGEFLGIKYGKFVPLSGIEFADSLLFLIVGIVGLITVTILSVINSKMRGEKLFPKPIIHIIINLFLTGVIFFLLIPMLWIFGEVIYQTGVMILPFVLLFYGFLIIISRLLIPKYIVYFGSICFLFGILIYISLLINLYRNSMFNLVDYYDEIILLLFGLGHLIMAYFLKIDNDKNG